MAITHAVLSCTDNPLYSFFLPITAWGWHRMGIPPIVFIPPAEELSESFKMAMSFCPNTTQFHHFNVEDKFKFVTASQIVRLLACCLDLPLEDSLITSDIDMLVLDSKYLTTKENNNMTIFGVDLTEPSQFPMCYANGTVEQWKQVMKTNDKSYHDMLEYYLGPVEGNEHTKGNAWCLDQYLLKQCVDSSGLPVFKINRSNGKNQFATRRIDRDFWNIFQKDVIDCHMPRPGYTETHIKMIIDLLKSQYPQDNLDWITEYRNAYLELL